MGQLEEITRRHVVSPREPPFSRNELMLVTLQSRKRVRGRVFQQPRKLRKVYRVVTRPRWCVERHVARFTREQAEGKDAASAPRGVSSARYHVWRLRSHKTCRNTLYRGVYFKLLLAVGKINRVRVNANEALAEPSKTPHPAKRAPEGSIISL